MILVVAPYNGALPESSRFLAGSKKIRAIIKILGTLDSHIVLLNSGHQKSENRCKVINQVDLDGECLIDVISPPSRKNCHIGRVLNIVNVPFIIADIIATYGMPDIAWFYNGYAFEMRAAYCLSRRYCIPTFIEFEDWHFARNRGLNPKPYIDWLFWRMTIKRIDSGFAVNSILLNILEKYGVTAKLLPGIVAEAVSEIAINSPPFKSDKIIVGYFGGLCEEKGAGVLLRLAKKTDNKISFIITGSGVLEHEFEELEKAMPGRLKYLGPVSETDLLTAISDVDVIINAHHVNDGVFPYKILETLASGRLLISTNLPMEGYECFSDAIQFYDGDEDNLLDIVSNAHFIYEKKKLYIMTSSEIAKEKYGKSGLIKLIQETLAIYVK